jgi:hypothetical protein
MKKALSYRPGSRSKKARGSLPPATYTPEKGPDFMRKHRESFQKLLAGGQQAAVDRSFENYDSWAPRVPIPQISFKNGDQLVMVHSGDKKLEIPVDYEDRAPNSDPDLQARYFEDNNRMAVYIEQSRNYVDIVVGGILKRHQFHGKTGKPPSADDLLGELIETNAHHEAMHAALFHHFDLDNIGLKGVKKRRPIPMGHYQYHKRDLAYHHKIELHELIANAYGLSRSGACSAVYASNILGHPLPSYQFAAAALKFEMLNHPGINTRNILEAIKEQEKRGNQSQLVDIVMRMPDEELHLMGERLTKFGLYLLEEDKEQ